MFICRCQQEPLPPHPHRPPLQKNLGTISNKGFEINTDIDIYKDKKWKVNFATNATFVKNKIVKLPEQNKDGIISGKLQDSRR